MQLTTEVGTAVVGLPALVRSIATNPRVLAALGLGADEAAQLASNLVPSPTARGAGSRDELLGGNNSNSISDDEISRVNQIGGEDNCAGCAIAGDATLAGHQASAIDHGPVTLRELQEFYNSTFNNVGGEARIIDHFNDLGSGSRGIVYGHVGDDDIGHYFNVVNDNGTVRFIDFQNGGELSELSNVSAYVSDLGMG